MVEHNLAKVRVAGSSPVFRSIFIIILNHNWVLFHTNETRLFCMVTIAFIIKLKAAVRKGTTAFKT